MFDSHCHLHDSRVVDPAAQLARARAAGVYGCLLAGVNPEGWSRQLELAREYPECALSFGIHPQEVPELSGPAQRASLDALETQLRLKDPPRAVALGEIGLDRATAELRAVLPQQQEMFRAQLALARALDLPVILHVVDAHGLVLQILKQDGVPKCGGVMHSFSGSSELVRDYEQLNLALSFSGAICNPRASRLHRAAAAVSDRRLLVETDAPYQTPQDHRPADNQLAFLPLIVAKLAQLRGAESERIGQLTETNARALFGL